jgi:hypothetical protein
MKFNICPQIKATLLSLLCLYFWSTSYALQLPEDGLEFHLDVRTLDYLPDGDALSQGWADQSGSGLIASNDQNSAPSYVANAGSGYPAVRFNGTSQYLEVTNMNLGPEQSVFVVFANRRSETLVNHQDALLSLSSSGGISSLSSSRAFSTAPDYPSLHAEASVGQVEGSWLNGHNTDDTTGDLFSNRYYVGSAIYSGHSNTNSLLIGLGTTSGQNAGKNDIREILIYNRALSETERHLVHRYLGAKYDIEVIKRSLQHPVESYPHPLASQQFGTQYSFGQDGIRTVDYARATLRQGNGIVKFRLSNKYSNTDGFTAQSGINSLVELVRDHPEMKTILDMPLTDYVFWVSTFAVPSWQSQLDDNGLKPDKATQIYYEIYNMVVYLLETYSGTGKRFYIGNWEGDWMLSGEYRNDITNLPQNRIQGMIDWANIRQEAVDAAKANTAHSDVDVWFYLEMNKADWMRNGDPCVVNSVIPQMPKLDMISISSYSMHKDNGNVPPTSRVHSDLDQINALFDSKPDSSIPGSRLMIGEYGWIYNDDYSNLTEFAQRHITTARSFLTWPGGTLRFLLQWQFFNQALKDNSIDSKEMSQIGPNNDVRPLYYMHENFLRTMRRWVDDFYWRNQVLPSDAAYVAQANQVLSSLSLTEYQPKIKFLNYSDWQNFNYINTEEYQNNAISGPAADPYNTGVSNLLRYGLGLRKFGFEKTRMPRLINQSNDLAYAFPFDINKSDIGTSVLMSSNLEEWTTVFDSSSIQLSNIFNENFESIQVVSGANLYSFGYDKDGGSSGYKTLEYGKWYKKKNTSDVTDVDADGDNELRPNSAGQTNAKMWGTIIDPSEFNSTGSGTYQFSVDLIGADTGTSKIYLWYARNFDGSGSNDLILDIVQGGFSAYTPLSATGSTEIGELLEYDIPDETANGSYSATFEYTAGDSVVLVFGSYDTNFAYDNVRIEKQTLSTDTPSTEGGFIELDANPSGQLEKFYRIQMDYNP